MQIDFGKTAEDYRRYRAGFPPALFTRLAARRIGVVPQRVVDLGTGAGTLARGFAARGCSVIGVDLSPALTTEAGRLDRDAGVHVQYITAAAEDTGLPAHEFDVVSAGQCWHWFDRIRVAREVRRLLKPGGWLVIAHFDWIPLPGNIAAMTETLIARHNAEWRFGGGTGMYPPWLHDVAVAGYADIETFSFDVDVLYTPEAWRGRIRASAGVAASLPPEAVARFDAELAALLQARCGDAMLSILHRVFVLTCRAPEDWA